MPSVVCAQLSLMKLACSVIIIQIFNKLLSVLSFDIRFMQHRSALFLYCCVISLHLIDLMNDSEEPLRKQDFTLQ